MCVCVCGETSLIQLSKQPSISCFVENLIRGLDDDEVDFLDIVDKAKMDAEKKQQVEEDNEIMEFRQRVATLQEQSIDQVSILICVSGTYHFHFSRLQKISAETAKPRTAKVVSSRPSQKSILASIVRKRKASTSLGEATEQLEKRSANKPTDANDSSKEQAGVQEDKSRQSKAPIVVSDLSEHDEGALKCIGILPGIGKYRESSDSEKSTDTDDEYDFGEFDWMGRKIKKDGEESGCH